MYGRGTLYMKWGQQNQRFGTMRLRGERDENKRNKKKRKEKILQILEMIEIKIL